MDHGMLNLPLDKRGAGSLDTQIDQWKAQEAKRVSEAHRESVRARKTQKEAEMARVKFTAQDLEGAKFVRDSLGWHKVVRVSAKSVTVSTNYSWTDRIALDKITEVKK